LRDSLGQYGALGQRSQARRDWRDHLRRQSAVAGQAVPADISADRQHYAEQHYRPGGHTPAWHRGWKSQLGQPVDVVRLGTEPPRQLVRIKPERPGVAAQEADRIGVAGQVCDAALLQRRQERQANSQCTCHRLQRPAKPQARCRQVRSDAWRRSNRVRICGKGGHIGPTSRKVTSAFVQHERPDLIRIRLMPELRRQNADAIQSRQCHFSNAPTLTRIGARVTRRFGSELF
jgi:hypothetical protein